MMATRQLTIYTFIFLSLISCISIKAALADTTLGSKQFAIEIEGKAIFIGAITENRETSTLLLKADPALYSNLAQWINEIQSDAATARSGSFVVLDQDGNTINSKAFNEALITKIQFSPLDGSSKATLNTSIIMQTDTLRDAYLPPAITAIPDSTQKKWLASNFKLEMGSLPTSNVIRIEGIELKKDKTEDGGSRLVYPDLTITIAAVDAQPWYEWFEDFVIRGNCGQQSEVKGAITLYSTENSALQINLGTMQILSLSRTTDKTSGEKVVKAEVAIETLQIENEGFDIR